MLGFRDVYPDAKLIELTVNYRCADSIIAAAGKVIAQNKQRFDKRIEGSGRSKGKVIISDFPCDMKEAMYDPYKSYAYKDMYHYLCLA